MIGDWKRCSVTEFIANGILAIGDGYRAKNQELGPTGLPFARAGNVSIDGEFQFRDADRFPEEDLERVGIKVSQPCDAVFTSKGTVGRLAFVREDTERFVYSPQLSFWRVLDPSQINPRFLYFWMSGPEFYEQTYRVKGQTDMADYVSLRDQRQMYITLPSLPIQRRIADILGALDDKIEINRHINRTLEAMAQALHKHWFIDFGPFQDGEFVESELGMIPKGWTVMSLDDVADFLNGLPLQKYPPEGEGYLPVIKIAELRRGVTDSSGRASTNIEQKYMVDDGDVLFSWSGSLEVCIWCGGRGALNQHLFKVTSSNYPKWFYHQWIEHHLPEFRAIAAAKATTMGHIQRYHLSEAKVIVPPEDTLRIMNETMTSLLECFIKNNLESRLLATTRDYLLPKLLSGEIPVEAAEEAVADVV